MTNVKFALGHSTEPTDFLTKHPFQDAVADPPKDMSLSGYSTRRGLRTCKLKYNVLDEPSYDAIVTELGLSVADDSDITVLLSTSSTTQTAFNAIVYKPNASETFSKGVKRYNDVVFDLLLLMEVTFA